MSSTGDEKFCLRWNDFENNISNAFKELNADKDFFDITLACAGDRQVQAHKLILSACSPFFKSILKKNPHQHPLVYLKGVQYEEILSVLNFMYHGEVNIAQEELTSFLAVAEELQVKGLTQNNVETSKPNTKNQSITNKSRKVTDTLLTPPPLKKQRSELGFEHGTKNSANENISTQIKIEEPVLIDCDPIQEISEPILETETFQEQGYDYNQDYESHGQIGQYGGDLVHAQDIDLTEDIYSQHIRKGSDGEFLCNICDKKDRDSYAIKKHLEGKHDITPGYNCPVCNLFCRTSSILEYHRRIYHS